MNAVRGLAESPSDDELFSLAGFLAERPCGRRSMSLEETHGFLTALHCVPGALLPLAWLPAIFGGDVEKGRRREGAEMIALAMRMSNEIARSLFDTSNQDTFVPLIAFAGRGASASAAAWCDGFLKGLDLKARAWVEHIEEDPELRRVLCPIVALSSRFRAVLAAMDEAEREAVGDAEEEDLEAMLPDAVLSAYTYWRLGTPAFDIMTASAAATASV
ncbi:MAG: YecA family protein [Deltaproteobacteria bacterium]|nr:YecA family protein [Deltaproteobacteria bacterium]